MKNKLTLSLSAALGLFLCASTCFASTNEFRPLFPVVMTGSDVSVNSTDNNKYLVNGSKITNNPHQISIDSSSETSVVLLKDLNPRNHITSKQLEIDVMIKDDGNPSALTSFISMTSTFHSGSNTVKIILDAANQKVIFEQYLGSTLAQQHEESVNLIPNWTYHLILNRDITDSGLDYFGIFPAGQLPPDVDQNFVLFTKTFSEIGFPAQNNLDSTFYFVGTENTKASFWNDQFSQTREESAPLVTQK